MGGYKFVEGAILLQPRISCVPGKMTITAGLYTHASNIFTMGLSHTYYTAMNILMEVITLPTNSFPFLLWEGGREGGRATRNKKESSYLDPSPEPLRLK